METWRKQINHHLDKFIFPPYRRSAPTNHIYSVFNKREIHRSMRQIRKNQQNDRKKGKGIRHAVNTIISYICIKNAGPKRTQGRSAKEKKTIEVTIMWHLPTKNSIMILTYMNFPSSQSDAILNRSGGLSGFPSVRNSWLPVRPTTIGAIGAASFSRRGTPRRKGSLEKKNVKLQIVKYQIIQRTRIVKPSALLIVFPYWKHKQEEVDCKQRDWFPAKILN